MRTVLQFFLIIFLGLGIFLLDLVSKNILPYPFNALNLGFVGLILFLIIRNSGKVVWLSFVIHLFLDVYSATPFGIFLFAGTITMLFEYWFYRDLFTNKSVWTLMVMTASGLIIFRVLYTLNITFVRDVLWQDVFVYYAWEMLFTLLATIIFYMFINLLAGRRI